MSIQPVRSLKWFRYGGHGAAFCQSCLASIACITPLSVVSFAQHFPPVRVARAMSIHPVGRCIGFRYGDMERRAVRVAWPVACITPLSVVIFAQHLRPCQYVAYIT
ncbi:hypothetical protein AVEN_90851-1 [Araneus ventricosus]|uniref:Uncharacterized protein n=1 Tax=Araneus ventricosus TaxID=182803 RepID=A0A4Y2LDB5_ARAVE|nr:hypothetical protein AVEN_90851-1 [Araneus ventricosus]